MKKKYSTPQVHVVAVSPVHVIAASATPSSLKYGSSNETEGPTVAESFGFAGGLTEEENTDDSLF